MNEVGILYSSIIALATCNVRLETHDSCREHVSGNAAILHALATLSLIKIGAGSDDTGNKPFYVPIAASDRTLHCYDRSFSKWHNNYPYRRYQLLVQTKIAIDQPADRQPRHPSITLQISKKKNTHKNLNEAASGQQHLNPHPSNPLPTQQTLPIGQHVRNSVALVQASP
jgi:hypothetical protein